jgi:hypothetical protein
MDSERSDKQRARDLLVKLANEGANFTPGVAIELAAMLCHIAGGDGRGLYRIEHEPDPRPQHRPPFRTEDR